MAISKQQTLFAAFPCQLLSPCKIIVWRSANGLHISVSHITHSPIKLKLMYYEGDECEWNKAIGIERLKSMTLHV